MLNDACLSKLMRNASKSSAAEQTSFVGPFLIDSKSASQSLLINQVPQEQLHAFDYPTQLVSQAGHGSLSSERKIGRSIAACNPRETWGTGAISQGARHACGH